MKSTIYLRKIEYKIDYTIYSLHEKKLHYPKQKQVIITNYGKSKKKLSPFLSCHYQYLFHSGLKIDLIVLRKESEMKTVR